MLRTASQFVSIALAIILLALPLLACLTPGAEMSMEQRECCEKMAGRCETSTMPNSHSCCQHPVSDQAVAASRIQSSDFRSAVAPLASPFFPLPRPMRGIGASPFESPPKTPPQIVSVLRI